MHRKASVKTYLLLIVSTLFLLGAEAQIMVTPQIPVVGVTQKSQLWNLVIANTSSASYDIQIELSLFDIGTNQKVLSGSSRRFQLEKGSKVLQWNAVQPVIYNATGNGNIDGNPNGFLPAGYYRVCFTVMRYVSDSKEPIAEECTEMEIAPLSPPQLALPADKGVVEESYPQFTWIPPVPLNLFQRLSYELKVVELLPNQSYDEAIQNNLPFLTRDHIVQPLYSYPASSKAFETGKEYVWQVTAKDVNNYSVKTDVWLFSLKKKPEPKKQTFTYVRLHQNLNPSQFVSNGILKIAYINRENDKEVFYRIYSGEENSSSKMKGKIELRPGENFIDLKIEDSRKMQEGEAYVFELTNSKGEKWMMQFVFHLNESIEHSQ